MNHSALVLAGFVVWPLVAQGQLEWLPSETPQAVFGGGEHAIRATVRNAAEKSVELDVHTRLFQLSSGSAMPVEEGRPWKTLKTLPGQTVMEEIAVRFPKVKARALFGLRWLDAKGKLLGQADIMVHPNDLLKQLATLASDKPFGVLDLDQNLTPTLRRLEMEFEDLEPGNALEKFEGKLAIVFARSAKLTGPRHLSERVAARAKEGVAFVWVQPAVNPPPLQEPRAYPVRLGNGTVVVVQGALVADLLDSPVSQLNLIRFAELALHPELLQLPETP